jgi:basic membrane protein A and related proteins
VKAGLKDGSFSIWKGPITGQDGKPIKGADGKEWTGSDEQLGGINFYVKGVDGKVPGGDKK